MVREKYVLTKKISFETNVTSEMFEKAFKFGMDYYLNPAKTLKDRTGDKTRGWGEIITANLVGKLIELGVCKILADNSTVGKQFFPDMDVSSEFVYNQPDISKISSKERIGLEPKFFIEIKNSPTNFRWISLYSTQFDEMKKWVEENMSNVRKPETKIFIIYARIVDKFGYEISVKDNEEENVDEENVDEEKNSKNKSYLNKREEDELADISKKIKVLKTARENLPMCSKSLGAKKQEECKDKKKELAKEIKNLENLKKNLLVTIPNRKRDLLGMILKHHLGTQNEIAEDTQYLQDALNDFYDLDDLKIVIDYIVSGKELKDNGRELKKNLPWPDPEIFSKKKNQKFENSEKTTWKKINCKTKKGKQILPVENIMRDTKPIYPEIFGEWVCKGKFNLYQQKTTRKSGVKEKVNSTLFIECKTDVELCNNFLKNQNFQKNDIWSMSIKNILGGDKGKSVTDIAIPKNIVDDIVTEKLPKRIIRIAEEI